MNKKIFLKYLTTIVITLLTLFFLFKGVRFLEIKDSFVVNWGIILLALVLFFIIKLINTFRFSKMYGAPFSKKLFYILSYSNMMLSIFPFRLGELSYISKLQKMTGDEYSKITSKLIKLRLFDYVSIYVLLMISSIYVYSKFSSIVQMVSGVFVASLILGLLGVFLVIRLNLGEKIKIKKISKILRVIELEVKNNLKINWLKDAYMLLISLFYWFIRLLMGYFILNMLEINLSFFVISFISLAVFMLSLIPIQFFAGFGITEAGFLFFLTQLGFQYDSTLITLLIYHIYLLIPVIVYGVVGLIGGRE